MFKIDPENMIIYLTRGDSAGIVFSASNCQGDQFHPTKNDRLIFSASKKFGEEPLVEIINTMGENESEEDFWSIQINPDDTKNLGFGKYVFDVEIEMRNSESGELEAVDTIIGQTDCVTPTLILWGEVSLESE